MRRTPLARSAAGLASALLAPAAAPADTVGELGVGWLGNDIVVEAIEDPQVRGVTCHVAYFERGLIERLSGGEWFDDAANAVVTCRQTGPIALGDVSPAPGGEDVFAPDRSVAFEALRIRRVLDEANRTLIYLVHAREPEEGSARLSISTVPLPGDALAHR